MFLVAFTFTFLEHVYNLSFVYTHVKIMLVYQQPPRRGEGRVMLDLCRSSLWPSRESAFKHGSFLRVLRTLEAVFKELSLGCWYRKVHEEIMVLHKQVPSATSKSFDALRNPLKDPENTQMEVI